MNITSVSDILSYLYSLSVDKASYCFRGQSNFTWSIQPTIYRYDGFERYQAVHHEKYILDLKPKSPCPPLLHTSYDIEWLMLCQHYGVPTRLLDWSNDVLVSLFFACSDQDEINADGALFICDETEYPKFSAYNAHPNGTQDLAFINTHIINPRVRMQSGSFMIWGHAPLNEKSKNSYDLYEYLVEKSNGQALMKLRIPAENKKSILKELDEVYSINNNSLYLSNGFLENKYLSEFDALKYKAKLMTLYVTQSSKLSVDEQRIARGYFKVDCRDMFSNCISQTNVR
ncbi:hypothetical protein CGI80_25440 [Vibrio parahaemolyticus]|nr:hypothetical protein CGI80_25440 [Vibrio parahaemolyticus]